MSILDELLKLMHILYLSCCLDNQFYPGETGSSFGARSVGEAENEVGNASGNAGELFLDKHRMDKVKYT